MALALLAGCSNGDDGVRNYAPPERNPERVTGEGGPEVGDGNQDVVKLHSASRSRSTSSSVV